MKYDIIMLYPGHHTSYILLKW